MHWSASKLLNHVFCHHQELDTCQQSSKIQLIIMSLLSDDSGFDYVRINMLISLHVGFALEDFKKRVQSRVGIIPECHVTRDSDRLSIDVSTELVASHLVNEVCGEFAVREHRWGGTEPEAGRAAQRRRAVCTLQEHLRHCRAPQGLASYSCYSSRSRSRGRAHLSARFGQIGRLQRSGIWMKSDLKSSIVAGLFH